ncbi:MAG: hypothetical protein ABR498_03595 [Candidatus Dormibacteria bacterium]
MAASTVTRATWVNDTGTSSAPNLDGTLLTNTRLQNDIYAKIDEMFAGAGAYATFTLGGLFAVEGFGSHSLSAAGTGFNALLIRNTTGGTGNGARLQVRANSTTLCSMTMHATTFTTSGSTIADGALIACDGAGGITQQASHASGSFKWYTGSTLQLTLTSGGLFQSTGFGTHSFIAGGTGYETLTVQNTTAGTGNGARISVFNDGSVGAGLYAYASTFTSSGYQQANGAALIADGAGGLSILASNGSGVIRFYTGGVTERARMLTGGQWQIVDGSAATPAIAFASNTTTGIYNTTTGSGDIAFAVAGVQVCKVSQTGLTMVSRDNGASATATFVYLGRNTNASGAGGTVIFNNLGNIDNYVWIDNSASPGVMRVHTTNPSIAGDTAGTVVGSQTSNLRSKIVHGWASNDTRQWALQQIVDTPIAEFSYRAMWAGERFWGLVTDRSPLFGLDRDADHPGGKMLNEVMAHGCAFLAIQQLKAEVDALRAHIAGS